jgi:hypothetical protein
MKRHGAALCCAFLLMTCKKDEAAAPPAAGLPPPAGAPTHKKESDDRCVGPLASGTKETFQLNGQTYEHVGHVLTRVSSDPDDQVVLGVLSDVKDASDQNLKNVAEALEFFKAHQAELVLFLGDSAEKRDGVSAVFGALAKGGLPVFVIIGNRECRDHYVEGMSEAKKEHRNLFDFTQIRVFNSDDISILSLPGYYNPTYLHCSEGAGGCRYFPSDVDGLKPLLAQASSTPMLISHGPPRMDGVAGLDRIHDNANVGDPLLAEFLRRNPIPFGAFANISESGGKATDAAGKTVIPQETLSATLYLNSGSVDSVPWQMLDGTTSQGMAAVMTVKGKQASYKIKRFGPTQPSSK